ncbi:MAG: sugar phosphate isomerase/epimerase [Bacteroidetes bacterium]|nr:sugar phosphate isomerase/epimerase [Bacteroidota bacterium]MBU1116948.1 sugar phosphate isomerase/epimerase [Bacteroidota bacterium]MBU1799121.1 sugar phosphate isomerase/epimerase [Bacteroidota bacterium]
MIKIANAPCSWGALEFDLGGKAPDYIQVLNEIKETGYVGTELGDWGFMPTDPSELKNELEQRNLILLGAFIPVLLKDLSKHSDGIQNAVKTAKLMKDAGFPNAFIVLADENGTIPERTNNAGRIKPDMSLSSEEWKIFCEGANKLAENVLSETGLKTVFHHHCGGYVETPDEVKMLMDNTDPNLLGLVLDMGHYKFGGGDPLIALKEYQDRIWHIHFKDCDEEIAKLSRSNNWDYFESVKNGVFCELGKGSVDFESIVKQLVNTKYDGWIVVEQDVLPGMGKPKECALHNREFIKSLGL